MPLGDTPVLEVLIRRLIAYGITDVTLTLGHLAELIKAYFHQRRQLLSELTLRYVEEEEPTGTAGSLSLVPGLDSTFLVMNGDLLTNLDFDALVQFHQEHKAMLTIATHERHIKVDLGVLEFNDNYQIEKYLEKPESSYHVSMGVYVYEPGVLKHIKRGVYLDFPSLVNQLLEQNQRVLAYPTDCLWLDIGRPDDYAKAQELFSEKTDDFELV